LGVKPIEKEMGLKKNINFRKPENKPKIGLILVETKTGGRISDYDDYPFIPSEETKKKLIWSEGFNQYILPQE